MAHATEPLLFIPTYNCAPQIGRVLEKVAAFSERKFSEILVVDNRSEDSTVEAAQAAVRRLGLTRVSIVRNRKNYGLGGTHKAVFEYARAKGIEYCMILHGDDQAHVNDFAEILADSVFTQFDLVLGSRFASGSINRGYSKVRLMGNIGLNVLASAVLNRRISDLGGSGLNVFRPSAFCGSGGPAYMEFSDDLTFHAQLIISAVANRLRYRFHPITWVEEDQISNAKIFRQSRKIIQQLIHYRLAPSDFLLNTQGAAHGTYAFDPATPPPNRDQKTIG